MDFELRNAELDKNYAEEKRDLSAERCDVLEAQLTKARTSEREAYRNCKAASAKLQSEREKTHPQLMENKSIQSKRDEECAAIAAEMRRISEQSASEHTQMRECFAKADKAESEQERTALVEEARRHMILRDDANRRVAELKAKRASVKADAKSKIVQVRSASYHLAQKALSVAKAEHIKATRRLKALEAEYTAARDERDLWSEKAQEGAEAYDKALRAVRAGSLIPKVTLGTYKDYPAKTKEYANGRTDIYFGNNPDGPGHGHAILQDGELIDERPCTQEDA